MNASITSAMVQDSHPSTTNNGNLYNDQSSIPIVQSSGPFVTASKMMPVPESLMSPDCAPPMITQQRPVSNLISSTTTHTTSSGKNIRYSQNQRSGSTPHSATKSSSRVLKKQEKSSPSNSPRKAMDNTTNSKIHQNQSILKQTIQQQQQLHSQLYEASTTISSVATTEDEDDEEMNVEKLKSVHKVAKKSQKQHENSHQQKMVENKNIENSAILIQKLWRGYNTRKKTVRDMAETLQQKRTQDYIFKLTKDMEMTKQALENERKIQQLQMQAINALWKKVSNMQTIPEPSGSGENGANGLGGQEIVQTLTKTCSILTNQVQQLQVSMGDILNCMTIFSQLPHMQNSCDRTTSSGFRDSSETQTEIIAVHTPQIENQKDFPFVHKIQRPSSLPINSSSNNSSASTKSNTGNSKDLDSINECNGDETHAVTDVSEKKH